MNHMSKVLRFVCFSPVLFLSLGVNATPIKTVQDDFDFPAGIKRVSNLADHVTAAKNESEPGRKLASNSKDLNERSLSEEFKKFRDEKILKIKTPEQLDALIAEVDRDYDTYSEDKKIVAIGISALKPVRGFLYRARPFVEKTSALHSAVLSEVRKNFSLIHTLLPAPQWTALLIFAAEPSSPTVNRFQTEIDVQLYLAKEVYPALQTVSERLKKLSLAEPVAIDNQIFFGQGSFASDLDRYHSFSDAERCAILSQVHQTMASVSFLLAYHWTDLLNVYSSLSTLYGIDGFKGVFTHKVDGAPARERIAVINQYPNFLILRGNKHGEEAMKLSLYHLGESIFYANDVWTKLKGRAADYQSYLDPASMNDKVHQAPLIFASWNQILAGPATMTSQITNETVKMDLPLFFNSPPKDLKKFLPTGFVDLPKTYDKVVGGVKMTFRNYTEGSPAKWNLDTYRTYFPKGISTDTDVTKAARVLNQSWGGDLIGRYFQYVVE